MYRYTINVEPEMYDYSGDNWSHQNSNKMFKGIFGNDTRKTFSRFAIKVSTEGAVV
jgi:hypothetical protein